MQVSDKVPFPPPPVVSTSRKQQIVGQMECAVRKLINFDNTNVDGVYVGSESNKQLTSIVNACREFLYLHGDELKESVDDLDLSDVNVHKTVVDVWEQIVSTGFNCGRIIAVLCMTKAVVDRVTAEKRVYLVESIVEWMKETMSNTRAVEWIAENTDWVSCDSRGVGDSKIGREGERLQM